MRPINDNASNEVQVAPPDSIGLAGVLAAIGCPVLEGPPLVSSEAWLDRMHADHNNIVQLSKPASMCADSISHAASKVFETFVAVAGSDQR